MDANPKWFFKTVNTYLRFRDLSLAAVMQTFHSYEVLIWGNIRFLANVSFFPQLLHYVDRLILFSTLLRSFNTWGGWAATPSISPNIYLISLKSLFRGFKKTFDPRNHPLSSNLCIGFSFIVVTLITVQPSKKDENSNLVILGTFLTN